MPLEPDGFREQLERLSERYPGRETLSSKEVSELLDLDFRTLLADKRFPAKKAGRQYKIPLVKLAWWLAS